VIDRVVYTHLLRHSRLEGRLRLRFSLAWLARGARLSVTPTRQSVRRLIDHGALRLIQRTKAGHVIEVRLPDEIPALRASRISAPPHPALPLAADIEAADFLQNKALRAAIHARERDACFYCLRGLTPAVKCLDHVVPQANGGSNSYRNLVSGCLECNSDKRHHSATDFLRWLYRKRRLTAAELDGRLRALDALLAGKLRPPLAPAGNPLPRKGRPPLRPTNS
jgi:hypothetical protein